MQTGTARGQTVHRWLAWTGYLEIANVFPFDALIWVNTRGGDRPLPYISIGMATLGLILIEGGLYWLLKRRRVGKCWFPASG